MKVNNVLPCVTIISETKINPQSLDGFMKKVGISKEWNEEHHKRNLNSNLSDLEKLPEALHSLRNPIPEGSTADFNKTVPRDLLKSIHISIGVNYISKDFIFEINQLSNFKITTSDINHDDLCFWVNPCIMDDDKAAIYYGTVIAEASKRVSELGEYIKTNEQATDIEKKKAIDRLMPMATQIDCIISGSLYDFQKAIYEGTDYNKLDEMRFVLIELTRKLKLKYNSLFYNFVLVDAEDNEFGLDTINSESNGWRNYKIKIRGV